MLLVRHAFVEILRKPSISISKYGDPHVHYPCEKCQGKATWRMTAWRHMRPNDRVSDIAKQSLCNVGEDPELDVHSDGNFEEMEVYSADIFATTLCRLLPR